MILMNEFFVKKFILRFSYELIATLEIAIYSHYQCVHIYFGTEPKWLAIARFVRCFLSGLIGRDLSLQ